MTDTRRNASQLSALVYDELRGIAARLMQRERKDHTLQPTALVNEAYLRLSKLHKDDWESRTHFLAMAARQMRRVLVEHARRVSTLKRGGDAQRVTMGGGVLARDARALEILEVNDALDRLRALDERQSDVAEMRVFAGVTEEEIAQQLAISVRTVKRDWAAARAWLARELAGA